MVLRSKYLHWYLQDRSAEMIIAAVAAAVVVKIIIFQVKKMVDLIIPQDSKSLRNLNKPTLS